MERFIHLWCGLLYCITYANIYSIQLIVHSCTRYRCISEAITWIHLQAIPALSRSLRLIIANKYIIIQILWYSNSCANCVQVLAKIKKRKKNERASIQKYLLFIPGLIFFIPTNIARFFSKISCHLSLREYFLKFKIQFLWKI